MRVVIIGAEGFVGSAFVRLLARNEDVQLSKVVVDNYEEMRGTRSDVVIEAACNSRKFLADDDPASDFEFSVGHRIRTLLDFPSDLHVHLSSVDVYSDLGCPETTTEGYPIDLRGVSNYGFHKLLAEECVQHYARRWLIVRLAGMVGPGLRKNPVFDVLSGRPLWIHPDSQYQFMLTDDVARVTLALIEAGQVNKVFNVCGDGLITPRVIAKMAGRSLDLNSNLKESTPRIVHINIGKVSQFAKVPNTTETLREFLDAWYQHTSIRREMRHSLPPNSRQQYSRRWSRVNRPS